MDSSDPNARAWLRLLRAGVVASALRKATEACGSAVAALALSQAEWRATGANADTLEPVDVSAVAPPADDTSEPTPAD